MNSIDDDLRDEWYAELVDEITEDAINAFTFDRLRSYYISNPNLAIAVFDIHDEAEKVKIVSASSALVLFMTSIELGLKVALLEPVVYGLVHNDSVASLISNLVVRNNGLDRIGGLLVAVLKTYGNINFDEFKIEGYEKIMREQIIALQKIRNSVVHKGILVDHEIAEQARVVSQTILDVFLVAVLNGLDLKISAQQTIEEITSYPQFDQWCNAKTSFHTTLRLLREGEEFELFSGIAVIFDDSNPQGSCIIVENLKDELPPYLVHYPKSVKIYWKSVKDFAERQSLFQALGPTPFFVPR